MSTSSTYRDGVLIEARDDATQTVTTYGAGGVVTSTRPYTAAEIDAANAANAAALLDTNAAALLAKADAALATNATFRALASPTNAQTLAQVKALTRQVSALLRLARRDLLNTTDGT